MLPEENCVAIIEGTSSTVGRVEEDFYCHGMIEGIREKQIIMSCILSATFVEPIVEIAKGSLIFRRDTASEFSSECLIGNYVNYR